MSHTVSSSVRRFPLHIWHHGMPACLVAPPRSTRFQFGGEKVRNQKNTRNYSRSVGEGRRMVIFLPFFHPCFCKSLHSFINGTDSRKPLVQRETEQLERLAPRAPKRHRRAMERGKPERSVPCPTRAALPRGMRNCGAGGGRPCLSEDLGL